MKPPTTTADPGWPEATLTFASSTDVIGVNRLRLGMQVDFKILPDGSTEVLDVRHPDNEDTLP